MFSRDHYTQLDMDGVYNGSRAVGAAAAPGLGRTSLPGSPRRRPQAEPSGMIRGLLARPGGEPYLGGRFSVEITEDRPRNAPTYRPQRRKRRQGVAVLARDGHQVGRVSRARPRREQRARPA